MQPTTTQEDVEYASVSWRFAAVLIDTIVLFGVLIIVVMGYVLVLAAQGKIDPNDSAAVADLSTRLQLSNWVANVMVFGGLFLYYFVLESLFSASVGKLVLRMRVTATDGSRPGGMAVLVRNVVRLPEAWLLYLPAVLSCLVSPRRQRLGDHAGRTIVVRRRAAPGVGTAYAPAPPADPAARIPPAPPVVAVRAAVPAAPSTPSPVDLDQALARLKTAALATRGAHLGYLRFSERELAKQPMDAGGYSDEYVSAWFTLTQTVAELTAAHDAAAATTASGETLDTATAGQADLAHLLRELAPYFSARTDEDIHDAFLAVARAETSPSS